MAKADLHLHSTASDGRMSPADVVQQAQKMKLPAIALTDHDTVAGYQKARMEAEEGSLQVIAGVELTTKFNDRECHLLAYCFDDEEPDFRTLLKSHQQARMDRARWIIDELATQGISVDVDLVLAEAGGRNVGRPHIAAVLEETGYVSSHREAFIRYLSDEALGTIPSNYRNMAKVIEIVKKSGGICIIAHPGRLYSEQDFNAFVDRGIDGMEAVHPSHNYEIQKKIEAFAAFHNLITTGGSDYHGQARSYYRHFGTLGTDAQTLQKMQRLAENRTQLRAQ